MPKATTVESTFLKKRLLGSEELADSEKLFVPKNTSFYITDSSPERNQHQRLTLASPLTAKDGVSKLQVVYAYEPHLHIEGEEVNQVIQLDVPYCSQMDNDTRIFGPGSRQCNTTSNTMLADYLLKGALTKQAKQQGYPEAESVFMRIVKKYGDTTNSDAQTKALKEIGIDSYFSRTLASKDVLASLKAGIPVVIGVKYKAHGHYCLIVGHNPAKKIWLVHDPFGTRLGASNSYDVGVGGRFDPYTYETMQAVLWDLGIESGWGRIVTGVNGKSTGLPLGL